MQKNHKIEILMATYNGEKYIEEQIESLLNQTYNNWKLTIRDDGSQDKTMEIINFYKEKYPQRISILKDNKGGLRAKENFLELLRNSSENYVMFCDQDDIWLPNKIEITLKKMLEVENGPTLIHTDLKVVNKNLDLIAESFWEFQKLTPERKTHNYLVVQNNVTGCTMMINKELIELSKQNFEMGIMHDWIIAIIASLKGKIEYIEERTILYRQHGNNDVGAKKYTLIYFIKKFFKNKKEIKDSTQKSRSQLFEIKIKIGLSNRQKIEIEKYLNLENKNFIYRKIWIIKNSYLKDGLYRKIGQILFE